MSMQSWANDNAGQVAREKVPEATPDSLPMYVWVLEITFADGTMHSQTVPALYQLGAAILDLTAKAAGVHGAITKIEAY